jgi:hypothetical protein
MRTAEPTSSGSETKHVEVGGCGVMSGQVGVFSTVEDLDGGREEEEVGRTIKARYVPRVAFAAAREVYLVVVVARQMRPCRQHHSRWWLPPVE